MTLQKTHHIDASEPDEDGLYEYYYAYSIYRFMLKETTLVARSYDDEPNQAHFLSKSGLGGEVQMLEPADLESVLLLEACAHLRAEGKTHIAYLSNSGYIELEA